MSTAFHCIGMKCRLLQSGTGLGDQLSVDDVREREWRKLGEEEEGGRTDPTDFRAWFRELEDGIFVLDGPAEASF